MLIRWGASKILKHANYLTFTYFLSEKKPDKADIGSDRDDSIVLLQN